MRKNDRRSFTKLRDAVSGIVSSLNGTMTGDRRIHSLAQSVSEGGSIGRIGIADAYVESLLTTKIVVVAQRDAWVDHFRLFEAFVGGAMVMTDLVTSLPAGLADGDNIVVYRSPQDLKAKLQHYLNPDHDVARLTHDCPKWL